MKPGLKHLYCWQLWCWLLSNNAHRIKSSELFLDPFHIGDGDPGIEIFFDDRMPVAQPRQPHVMVVTTGAVSISVTTTRAYGSGAEQPLTRTFMIGDGETPEDVANYIKDQFGFLGEFKEDVPGLDHFEL